jgi:hypothetical protein
MNSRIESKLRRLELVWAWGSLLTLIICWDAALRLDQHVSPPRVRIAHAAEVERPEQAFESTPSAKRH